MNTKWIRIDDVIIIHTRALNQTGGREGILNEGILQSAIQEPLNGFAGREFYPSIEEKAARLLFCIVRNHPFVDGNKRTGWLALRMVLKLNNKDFRWSVDEAERFVFSIADGSIDFPDILNWVQTRTSDTLMVEEQH